MPLPSRAGSVGFSMEIGSREVMILAGAEMAGSLMLLVAMAWHARYVLRDAEGLLPDRRPPAETEPADDEPVGHLLESPSSEGDRWVKIDPPHASPKPAIQRAAHRPRTVSAASTAPPASAPASSPVNRKLTKQERKVLKERLLRERLERQRRGL